MVVHFKCRSMPQCIACSHLPHNILHLSIYLTYVHSLNSTDFVKCVAPSTLLFEDHLCKWITFFICALWDASSIVMLLAISRLKLWGCCAARLVMSR